MDEPKAYDNLTENEVILEHQKTCDEMFNNVKPHLTKICQWKYQIFKNKYAW